MTEQTNTNENNENPIIDRPEHLGSLETRSPKQTATFILFSGLVLIILSGLFYLTFNKKDRSPTRKTSNSKIAKSPEFVETKVTQPPVETKPEPKPVSIVIPEEKPLRPQTVTLGQLTDKNNVNIPSEKPKPDPIYTRKLGGGSLLLGSVSGNEKNKIETPKASVFTAKASQLKNQDYLVIQGTKISCTMENALDSTIPGYTSCIVAEDVYSANGNVILIDRGTKIAGEYQSSLEHGQARLYVKWNRAVTPEGVTVELASGSAGSLGRAGITGYVDKHWFERFGNALLVSVIADALGYASDNTENENFENTESTVNEMATIAAEAGITIKPTINVNQGAEVIIYVQRDLDFSPIYHLVYDHNKAHD